MKIILTGSGGFLGKIIADTLSGEHEVIGVNRSAPSAIICDLSVDVPLLPPADIVVHAAGKAHSVPANELEEQEFVKVNVTGTTHLLQGIQASAKLPKVLVFISSVAVYGIESGELIDEKSPMNPVSAYGKSKAMAEKLVSEWGTRHSVDTIILRLPLVVGPDPPGNLGGMIKAIRNGYYFRIGDGAAKRSVVRAGDVARLIPNLVGKQGTYNLCDGYHPAVKEIEDVIATGLNKKIRGIPEVVAKIVARTGDIFPFVPLNSYKLNKLTQSLTFSDDLARKQLNWCPKVFSHDWQL